MKLKQPVMKSLTVVVLALSSIGANAAISFDQNVTNNVITGSGIANGGFTVDRVNVGNYGIEVGLRARERYDLVNNLPSNVTGSNNNGTYNQNAGEPPGFGSSNRARWSFDWSINTRATGTTTGGVSVSDYTYRLGMDFDAGFGTNFQTFDLINVAPFFDHSFGNNSTGQGLGVEATDNATYSSLKAANELVQNSWNYDFFDGGAFSFDPNANGNYHIFLEVIGTPGRVLARSDIDVIVGTGAVPEPGSMALVGLALAGLAVARRRKV